MNSDTFRNFKRPYFANLLMTSTTTHPGKEFLSPTFFIDSDNPTVRDFAKVHTQGKLLDTEKAVALFYATRDLFRYDPYHVDLRPEKLKASVVLANGYGYCVEKANLLAASARAVGIPSRLGFANVKNHLSTDKLIQILKSDIFVFHGFAELWLNGRWVKASPAFNIQLCERFGVPATDFNGVDDAIFQQYNSDGQKFMEYVKDHGSFTDLPRDLFIAELKAFYPHLFIGVELNGAVYKWDGDK
jgi:transglutaminase-like putative cysteine protease